MIPIEAKLEIENNYVKLGGDQISKKYGISKQSVHTYASKIGVTSNKRWEKERESIIQLYLNGWSLDRLADEYGHYESNIKKKLIEWGVNIRTQSEANRKFYIDETYFERIDTHNKAYILGLLYADGNIYCVKEKSKNVLQIALKSEDSYLLEFMKKELNSEHKIYKDRGNRKFLINSIRLVNDIKKLGVTERKSFTLEFPDKAILPIDYRNSFIRGYFDGDGSMSVYYSKFYGYKKWQFSVISSRSFCEKLANVLNEVCGNKFKIVDDKRHPGISSVYLGVSKENITILRNLYVYMYSGAEIYLERKKKKMEELVNEDK